jgi:hypothetical protein
MPIISAHSIISGLSLNFFFSGFDSGAGNFYFKSSQGLKLTPTGKTVGGD